MNADAIALLRTHSVVEVRDVGLEVSDNVARLHDRFAQKLREQYGEILEVTGSVGKLYECLKSGDLDLRDLCFKDELYKLKKLEPLEGKIEKEAEKRVDGSCCDDSAAAKVLLVSNWSLAISDFVSRFALSSSSSKLFDQVVEQFQRLDENDAWKDYEAVVCDKCGLFIQYLIDSRNNNVNFTVEQWTRIWSLVFKSSGQPPWNQEQLMQLSEVLFEAVLQEPLDVLMNNADDQVWDFVHSPEFEKKLNIKILADIEYQFQLLDDLASQEHQDDTPTFGYPRVLQELDIAQVVEDCRLHSMGLTTKSRVQMYNLVDPLIRMIDNLQAHGGQPGQVKELRNRVATLLENRIPVAAEQVQEAEDKKQEQTSKSPKTMDELVDSIMIHQNDSTALQLINRQINALKV